MARLNTNGCGEDPASENPAAERWRAALEAWRIPPEIMARAAGSPWVLATAKFVGRACIQREEPSGPSYQVGLEALPVGGSVLDVGAGAGAASLALRSRATMITAVDESDAMLATFAGLAPGSRSVRGTWPEVAPRVGPADVVVCHHVLYNVANLDAFVTALTAHARRRVVVEITSRHPMAQMNPLWKALHGVERPTGPVAADALAVVAETGVRPRSVAWQRPITRDGTSFDELVGSTCRRLCLGPDRLGDVEAALRDLGAGPDRPYLGDPMRDMVTIWWERTVGEDIR